MNPDSDAPLPALSDITSCLSVPSPPRYSAPTPSDTTSAPATSDPPLGSERSDPSSSTSSTDRPTSVQSLSLNRPRSVQSNPSNPYPAPFSPDSGQISIISDSFSCQSPDLECSICFSQFNNAFRCPKMLQCKHTFCLECLARMNVNSSEPSSIQCPLCRALTPLPTLGLPKLDTDPEVLSCLPAAMQRVYSVRFLRNKGRLQLKRADGLGALTQSTRRSLDVGLPSPVPRGSVGGARGGLGGALFRLTGRPVCRAFLLTAVIMMIVLLTAVIVFLLTTYSSKTP